jgi:transposase
MGVKSIASAFDISRNTVRRYVRMYDDSGISADKLPSLSDAQLQAMFALPSAREHTPSQRHLELEVLLPEYAMRLSNKKVKIQTLYAEYRTQHPDGYKHSTFGLKLNQYLLQTNAIGHVEHRAGDQMYIDFAGDRLEIIDAVTAEPRKVEVFVAILPCSHYTYCEAVMSQKKEDLIKACENALHFYGGAPMAIVPDNLKSAVTRSDRNNPVINPDFAAFAEHYGCAVVPARVRRPKDKALVENAVKLMYRSVYVDLEGMIFHDLETLNAAILKSLEAFNNRRLTRRKESRRQLFDTLEVPYLRALPSVRFQMKQRTVATVMRNSYVTLLKHHYSVPTMYIGKRMDLVYDSETIDIYYGFTHVTTHHRDDTPYEFTRKPAHNLPGRQGTYEDDIDHMLARAGEIDNIVVHYLKAVVESKTYPLLACRACRAILKLEKKYGQDRLVSGCAAAMDAHRFNPSDLIEILDTGADAPYLPGAEEDTPVSTTPNHRNIRGKEYYTNPHPSTTQNNQ